MENHERKTRNGKTGSGKTKLTYQQRNKGIACPICGRAYRHSAQKDMLQVTQISQSERRWCYPAKYVFSLWPLDVALITKVKYFVLVQYADRFDTPCVGNQSI